MKKMFVIIPLFIVSIGFTFSRIVDHSVKSVLEQIKLSEDDAMSYIFSSMSSSSLYIPNTRELKSFAKDDRPSIIKMAGEYIRKFSTSPEFIQRYKAYKESKKPTLPDPPQPVAELKAQYIANLKESIKGMEEAKKALPADQHAAMDETMKSFNDQLKDIDNNEMFSAETESLMKQGYDQQVDDYNNRLKEFELEYPEDPKPMIKKWLTSFLNETEDINFEAKLATGANGKQVFADTQYEYKSSFWKLCYRSGKETVEAARSFAKVWLKDLN